VTAGVTTKYAEFVLERDYIELPGVQEVGGSFVFLEILIVYLQTNAAWVFVVMIPIGHCHDGSV
jgi:hypothetical protein